MVLYQGTLRSTLLPYIHPLSRVSLVWYSRGGPNACPRFSRCYFLCSPGLPGCLLWDTDWSSVTVVCINKELGGTLSTMVQLYSERPALPGCLVSLHLSVSPDSPSPLALSSFSLLPCPLFRSCLGLSHISPFRICPHLIHLGQAG